MAERRCFNVSPLPLLLRLAIEGGKSRRGGYGRGPLSVGISVGVAAGVVPLTSMPPTRIMRGPCYDACHAKRFHAPHPGAGQVNPGQVNPGQVNPGQVNPGQAQQQKGANVTS